MYQVVTCSELLDNGGQGDHFLRIMYVIVLCDLGTNEKIKDVPGRGVK